MKLLILATGLLLTGCTVQLQDVEARDAINKHTQAISTMQVIDEAIALKLKELMDKGYLAKPEVKDDSSTKK